MNAVENKLNQLKLFRHRNKFSDKAWNERGLNPSDPVISSQLTLLLNQCTDVLIKGINDGIPDKELKDILKLHLSNFRKKNYDTEEREFICDLFSELASIININFSADLNNWLNGSTLSAILKIKAALNPQKPLETIHNICPNCGIDIEAFIISKKEGIPDYSWNIVQCNNCKDYLLISYGPGVEKVRHGNYVLIEQLPKESFSQEQAGIRLEQIRHFRK